MFSRMTNCLQQSWRAQRGNKLLNNCMKCMHTSRHTPEQTCYKLNGLRYTRQNYYRLHCPSLAYKERWISTSACDQGVNIRPVKITSRLAADQLIRDMDEEELNRLSRALEDLKQEIYLEKISEEAPSFQSLVLLAVSNSLPFIGFGFLDNAIMIVAGEYIDIKVGAMLGISTMAAAAFGNMISDVAGIGLAGYVEALVARMGFDGPRLTAKQLTMRATRVACHTGRAVGIVIGCIVGMFPLLFFSDDEHKESSRNETKKENKRL